LTVPPSRHPPQERLVERERHRALTEIRLPGRVGGAKDQAHACIRSAGVSNVEGLSRGGRLCEIDHEQVAPDEVVVVADVPLDVGGFRKGHRIRGGDPAGERQ
jgi:hypothetical protein